jgi:hypothetical protein
MVIKPATSETSDDKNTFIEKELESEKLGLRGVPHAFAVKSEESAADVSMFALIGLWHRKSGAMLCYRQFRVDNPLFLSKVDKDKTFQMEQMLHYTEDRETLFLLSGDKDELTLTVLDLEKCCGDDDKLQPYTANLFKLEGTQFKPKDKCLELLLDQYGL